MVVPCKLFETSLLQAVQTLVCQMPVDANMEHAEAFLKARLSTDVFLRMLCMRMLWRSTLT